MVATVLFAGCREPVGHGWDWNRMREQPKAVTYGAAGALPHGTAMQTPPAGTVPSDDDEPATPHDAARGADRFTIFCAVCHGDRGDGQSLMATNIKPIKPPTLLTGTAAALSDSALEAVIARGAGTMMGFGSDIPTADRHAIIGYIRQLQQVAKATP
jgi:mono/diheme cytochrome c family protein